MGKFDFSEDEITAMYRMYQDALNTVQEKTRSIVESLTTSANEYRYEPLIKLCIDAIDYYNDELPKTELKALEEWKNSDLGFTRLMDKMRAGEGAKARSQQLESEIEQEIHSWNKADSSGLSGIDTTNWKADVVGFGQIKENIDKYIESLETTHGEYVKTVEEKMEENEIYMSIEPVVSQSISIVISGFREGISESFGVFIAEVENKESELRNLGSQASQAMRSKADSFVSSSANELQQKIRQIMS